MGLGGNCLSPQRSCQKRPLPKSGDGSSPLESFWAAGWLLAAVISYFVIPSFGWQAASFNGAGRILCAVLAEKPSGITGASGIAAEKSIRGQAGSVWTKPYIRPTVPLSVVWFCVVFSYYGMFLWSLSVMLMKGYSMIESFEYVLLMTLAQLPGYFSAAWLIEKAGRKTILVIYLLGTAGGAYFFGAADSLAMPPQRACRCPSSISAHGACFTPIHRSSILRRSVRPVPAQRRPSAESAAFSVRFSSDRLRPERFVYSDFRRLLCGHPDCRHHHYYSRKRNETDRACAMSTLLGCFLVSGLLTDLYFSLIFLIFRRGKLLFQDNVAKKFLFL